MGVVFLLVFYSIMGNIVGPIILKAFRSAKRNNSTEGPFIDGFSRYYGKHQWLTDKHTGTT